MDALIQRIIKLNFWHLQIGLTKGDHRVPYTSIETIINTYREEVIIVITSLFNDPV